MDIDHNETLIPIASQQAITQEDDLFGRDFPREHTTSFCSICQIQDESIFLHLECGHTFHQLCILQWLHFDRMKCPNCNHPVALTHSRDILWSIRNVALSCEPTPEGMRIRQNGWYNIQLAVNTPPNVEIQRVKYVFHPAFNIPRLVMDKPPFDLLVKLCSSNVLVLVEIRFKWRDSSDVRKNLDYSHHNEEINIFTIAHKLEKEVCTRHYFAGEYNGLGNVAAENDPVVRSNIDVTRYFSDLLSLYRRPGNYYQSPSLPSVSSRNPYQSPPIDVSNAVPRSLAPPITSDPTLNGDENNEMIRDEDDASQHLAQSPSMLRNPFNQHQESSQPHAIRTPLSNVQTSTSNSHSSPMIPRNSIPEDIVIDGTVDLNDEEVQNVLAAILAHDRLSALQNESQSQ
ncbi:hypothetical protein BLNAU_12585 [Blattamonas nauphoetae]|uniref:RING-type domain-containing protein n=1 Tax=Blattamonas nauphoetae TaxID=2049346 RepID=A0ABQ9XNV5_9EUKA|nr:hypothetical protein BLNAU_12585 [Blattamonas nauphoetae]